MRRALGSRLDVGSDDVDLFVVYDANNDGAFTNSEIVASSTGGAGADEFIELVRPADGDYQVWAQGWQVAGTPMSRSGSTWSRATT